MNVLKALTMPPDCRKVARVLQSYLDGELPASQHAMVAEHLEHCDRCGFEAAVYREVKRALDGLTSEPDPRVIERLRAYAQALATTDKGP